MVAAVLERAGRRPTHRTRLLAAMLLGIAHHGVAAARRDPALDARHVQQLAADLALSGLRHMAADLLDPWRHDQHPLAIGVEENPLKPPLVDCGSDHGGAARALAPLPPIAARATARMEHERARRCMPRH